MPGRILRSLAIAPGVQRIEIEAPRIAQHHQAGQFVMLRVDEFGERIPLTVADWDAREGTITVIVQAAGASTSQLVAMPVGGEILDVLGPLGTPSRTERVGTVVVVAGGVGVAVAYPTARAYRRSGNRVIGIAGARSKQFVILEDELRAICDQLYITTDDGSYGTHGLVTESLHQLLESTLPVDRVVAVGPVPMMKAVTDLTRPRGIPTIVSLNPIMVDGVGMCGGCRATVAGKTAFVCVDGPEFDAFQVDFENLALRNRAYAAEEELVRKAQQDKVALEGPVG